jgi:predicted TIM-barrel fold metal-dependent hydrolase
LKLTVEDAIEPDLLICDAHHHLWYRTPHDYAIEDFLEDTSGGHNIGKTVYVESWMMLKEYWSPGEEPVSETETVEEVIGRNREGKTDVAAGIVAFADLTLGEAVVPLLESHLSASPERFRGIRQSCTWDPNPEIKSPWKTVKGLMSDPEFRKGFSRLSRYGLSFDAMLYHPQLPELVDLAGAFPDTTIILNHLGGTLNVGPYAARKAEVFDDWKKGMSALAACRNVFVKVGGIGMDIFGFEWSRRDTPPDSATLAEAVKPYLEWCVEKFGADRCMFESNFPVDKNAFSYTDIWNAFKRVTDGYSPDERRALFYDSAAKAYRLDR